MASRRPSPIAFLCFVVLLGGVSATPFRNEDTELWAGRQLADDVIAVAARTTPVADTPAPEADDGAETLRRRRPVEDPPALDDDEFTRKRKKKNDTSVGEEVITAIVDGLSGESEDAKFGSEIRQEFGILVQTVIKQGASVINQYVAGSGETRGSEEAPLGCAPCPHGASMEHHANRRARDVNNVGEGRRRQVRRLLVRYLVLLKVFALGIILPGAVLLSLLQSWKAVTLSLMGLLLAGVIGIRGLVSTAAKGQAAEVIHTSGPGGHYWRRVSGSEQDQEPDRFAYSAYVPVS